MNNKREQKTLAAAHLKSGKHDEGSLLQSLSKKRSMASKMSGVPATPKMGIPKNN